jgi:diaminopimelate decarboxylase
MNPPPPTFPARLEKRLRALAAEHPQPFYLYDVEAIRQMCRTFRALPASVHFACMANPHPRFLAIVREEGLDLFVNSLLHLHAARELGFRGDQLIFAASAMDDATMRAVAASGARVILDSLGQVERWRRVAPGRAFGVRCNVGGLVEAKPTRGGFFIGVESRLGLLPEELATLHGARDVAGLHLYVGTDLVDLDYFRRCYEALASLADPFPALEFVDFGGGFGVADETGRRFPIAALGELAGEVVGALARRLGRSLELMIEPGRIIGAEAGWFACRVVDVKARGGRQLLGVDASAVQFPRPLLYPDTAHHPVTLLPAGASGAAPAGPLALTTDVYGCSTYSRDYLAREVRLAPARPGDLVVLGQAGSYCAALFTHFLGFPRPLELFDERGEGPVRERASAVRGDRARDP